MATLRDDHDKIIDIVRDKPDFLDVMLNDDKLFQRVTEEEDVLLRISPWLLFSILVRRAVKQLATERFTIERVGSTGRIPVFDVDRVAGVMRNTALRDYLVDLLSSFVRTESTTIWYRSGRQFRRRSYSDMDVDDMISLAGNLEDESRYPYYKRIGDICLFIVGMFPEHVLSGYIPSLGLQAVARRSRKRRNLAEYEEAARRFYGLAAAHYVARSEGLGDVLATLSENFDLASKPLNLISDRYVRFQKARWFGQPS
ncbi:MAG: hypothetical protein M1358_15455 [Chloroflexi bacterium]|nr:hypothetical protein [Chloroflexota bacterium]